MRIFGFAGFSGSGKTTLLTKVLPVLVARGFSVSSIKHTHHAFDLDRPGKDSHAHREAGAHEVMIASASRWALLHELRDAAEPELAELLAHMVPVDFVLVEGFKRTAYPKIEIHRAATGKPPLYPDDPSIIAIASDDPVEPLGRITLSPDDVEAIADLVIARAADIA